MNKARPYSAQARTVFRTYSIRLTRPLLFALAGFAFVACGDDEELDEAGQLSARLTEALQSNGLNLDLFVLPASDDFTQIPQDSSNPLTAEKVTLGQALFHDTAFALDGRTDDLGGTWSCASCHHVAAGFKAGVPQGIGEGGLGFGTAGEARRLAAGLDPESADPALQPDVQPVTSPTALNSAYQEVMLWNGQFGNSEGSINEGIDPSLLYTSETPKEANLRQLAGLETQGVAGLGVHRMNVTDSALQTNETYQAMYSAAFPDGGDVLENAGKALAAYERTLLANEAPFQRWLGGDLAAMSPAELRGALLFFGKANCVACHTGPALSSQPGAPAGRMFFALGFADLDPSDPLVHGEIEDEVRRGRGGFTGQAADDYKFKIPPLYNLRDTDVFGHGASFRSIRDVVSYKNRAVAQSADAINLAAEFVPLDLTEDEIDDLTAFLRDALYDANLERYVPASVPSGECFPMADETSMADLGCQ